MKNKSLISFFAGIGGIDYGFEKAGVETAFANEIDSACARTYLLNFPKTPFYVGDIYSVSSSCLPTTDFLVGGFPCQAFSIAGYRKGFKDDRGILFFQLSRIIKELKEEGRPPRALFFENVKNLYSIEKGETYKTIKETLINLGYSVQEKIMNTCEYGDLPQNRERLYIVCFLDHEVMDRFSWPEPIELKHTTEKIIDWKSKNVDESCFYDKRFKVFPIIQSEIKNDHAVYQLRRVYLRRNKSGVCPALTANMGEGGHNVPIIMDDNGKIRRLTVRECQMIQGFPESFKFPKDLSNSIAYKQIGNSVSVKVITRIAKNMVKALYGE